MKKVLLGLLLILGFVVAPVVSAVEESDFYGTFYLKEKNDVVQGVYLDEEFFELLFTNPDVKDPNISLVLAWQEIIVNNDWLADLPEGAPFAYLDFSDHMTFPAFRIIVDLPEYKLNGEALEVVFNDEVLHSFTINEAGDLVDKLGNVFEKVE